MKPEKTCDKSMNFQECELAILRLAVDKAEEKMGKRVVQSDDIKKIIVILENFIKKKNLIAYGGTAINNILPKEDQFYNKEVEVPDYDCFTMDGLNDSIELADLYYKEGFTDVEAKSGQHHGTFKVYVNYMAIADLTNLPKEIYASLKKDAISVAGILYAPPNFLRMSMYLELSRPAGDISRWEKVLKRLTVLNKHYPTTSINCNEVEFQREMDDKTHEDEIYDCVKNTLINQGVVFFGGFAISMYSQYMPKHLKHKLEKIADFDVLSHDPETTCEIVKERLKDTGIQNVKVTKRANVGDIVPVHYEIKVGNDIIAFVYEPIGCHSYNVINIKGQKVKIATIDTMLSFYLAFLYTNRDYYTQFSDRILCMSKFLFDVQQKNRLSQRGLLKRFSITCYGHQQSVEEMRAEKAAKYKELRGKKGSDEYLEYFLSYKPEENKEKRAKKYDEKKKEKSSNKSSNKSKTVKKRKSGKKGKSFRLWGK
jgi:hypothetical protein